MSRLGTTLTFPPAALQDALASAIASGSFSDTAYYLYSRRLRNWKIGKPQVVYANSLVMKAASSYFVAQLEGGFSVDQKISPETEDYGYDSDSDLDDSEGQDDNIDDSQPEEQIQNPTVTISAASSQIVTTSPSAIHLVGPEHKYRIMIPDVASNTWHALVHFIYTGNISFAPLRSQGTQVRESAQIAHRKAYPYRPPLCSPKSMYRLADIIGISTLREMARQDLRSKVSATTITREVFSKFSSTYSEVLDMQLEVLYKDALLAEVMPKVLKTIGSVTQGQKPYCENVLSALLLKLSTLLSEPKHTSLPDGTESEKGFSAKLPRKLKAKRASEISERHMQHDEM